MKKSLTLIFLAAFILTAAAGVFASEFQQTQLINNFVGIRRVQWDDLSKKHKDLIDENLHELVKDRYYKILLKAEEDARDKNKARVIPSYIFVYADLGDYIAGKINKKGDLRFHLANEMIKDGRLPLATEIVNSVLISDPENLEAANLKGQLFLRMNMYQEAMVTYTKILKKDRKNEAALYNTALLYMSLGQYDKAAKQFKLFLKYHPDSKRQREARRFVDLYDGTSTGSVSKNVKRSAIEHFMAGERLYRMGKYNEAAEEYKLAVDEDPNFYRAYTFLGECLSRMKKYDQSIKVLEMASQLSPKESEAYFFLGLTYEKLYNFAHKKEQLQKAVENYEKALERDSGNTEIKGLLEKAKSRLEGI